MEVVVDIGADQPEKGKENWKNKGKKKDFTEF